jgi:translation initiation factor 4A
VHSIRQFVLDEADEMLSRGFKDQIFEILSRLPTPTQVMLNTTTMSADVLELAQRVMRDPIHIVAKREEPLLECIRQFYVAVEKEEWKLDAVIDLYETLMITQVCVFSVFPHSAHAVKCVIFCNTRRKVDWLTDHMYKREFTVSCIHGDMDQAGRDVSLKEFRSGSALVLITTDLFREIDLQQVPLVINYDLPINRKTYIHRYTYTSLPLVPPHPAQN